MPKNITTAHDNTLLDASLLNTDKLALISALGTVSTAGTEATGGSYARQTLTFAAAAASAKSTSAAQNFANMPTVSLQGWEVWDSAGTNRKWYGLWSQKSGTAQATGDTITYAAHGYTNGQKIVFQSTYTPTGLTAATTYFVVGATTNTFQVSATLGGSAIDITADSALCVFGIVLDVSSGATFTTASGQLIFTLN